MHVLKYAQSDAAAALCLREGLADVVGMRAGWPVLRSRRAEQLGQLDDDSWRLRK
jgi:hypothetical protein